MKRFYQLLILAFIAIYNAIQTVTGGVTVQKLMPTGVINQGILGGFSGKVGPVVGGKWKDVDYMRGYVVPANPNTAGQQAGRAKFAQLVKTARSLLSIILQQFWDPFYSNMSGFNAWISQNYALADSAGIIDETAIMAKGTLVPETLVTATYDTSTGNVVGTWVESSTGNAEGTDNVTFLVYDTVNEIFYNSTAAIRSLETGTFAIATGLTATNVILYAYLWRGTGSELIVSDSYGKVCAAP
jgi:hypothetical protein